MDNVHVLRIVRSGYRIQFSSPPPLSFHPIDFGAPKNPAKLAVLSAEVNSLLDKGAIRPADISRPGFYAHLFTVPKKSGGFRPVLDLSALNEFIRKVKFKMETTSSLRLALRPGDWATSLDLRDAYFHVSMAEDMKRFLRFVWRDKTFEFNVLPFGLSTAPLIFTSMVKELAALVRVNGTRLRTYLDDWLTLASTYSDCLRQSENVLQTTVRLGFQINFLKSDLIPSQQFLYLGMYFDTVLFTVAPSPERLSTFIRKRDFLLNLPSATHRQLLELLGMMESFANLLPLGRLFKRPLQREIHKRTRKPPLYEEVILLGHWFHI